MKIIRTFVPNSFANYNHLVYCPITKEAAAIDPFSAQHLIQIANDHQLTIKQIWITHEHGDHIRDMTKLKELTGAEIFAPKTCQGKFTADHWLDNNQIVPLGKGQCKHLLTPGHTPGHGVFLYLNPQTPGADFIACGDTLFNAGVGNVKSGDAHQLYKTIQLLSSELTPSTQIYSGHDYLVTNLNFTLHHCPQKTEVQSKLDLVINQTPEERQVQTWQDEQIINLFMNLDSAAVISLTGITGTDHSAQEQRFVALRHLRDEW